MYNLELLREAILKQAVKDYRFALKTKNPYAIATLERFFLSDWGQLLSYNKGGYIIRTVRKSLKK